MSAAKSQPRPSLRTVVQGIIDSQQSRAFVQPAAGRAPLLLRVKGTLMCEEYDKRHELRVMNCAGGPQAAESFVQYMQVVMGEIVALRDAIVVALQSDTDQDDWSWDDLLQEWWCEGLGLILAHLGVPWPLSPALNNVNIRAFDDLGEDRDAVAIDTRQILHDAMDLLTERCMFDTIDTYTLFDGLHEADGSVETCRDGLCWAVAGEGEFDPDFGKDPDADADY